MGIFRDVRKMTALANEVQKDYDPAAQMRDAREQMQQMTQQQQLVTSTTAVRSPATVVEIRDSGRIINHQPMFDCDVTVRPAAGMPFPATIAVMGAARLTVLTPGNEVTVLYEPGDTQQVALL